jgi:hypothetical protein
VQHGETRGSLHYGVLPMLNNTACDVYTALYRLNKKTQQELTVAFYVAKFF